MEKTGYISLAGILIHRGSTLIYMDQFQQVFYGYLPHRMSTFPYIQPKIVRGITIEDQ
jgi:hypothetical protein